MFIKQIPTTFIDKNHKLIQRVTTYGRYKGYGITIDTYSCKDRGVFEKNYVIWNDNMQKIVNKFKRKDGKFNRLG